MKTKIGIDVSKHQGAINWNLVSNDAIDFAIIRSGYGLVKDKYADRNVENALANGISVNGLYIFSYALNTTDVKNEAKAIINYAKKMKLPRDTVLYYDLEYDTIRYAEEHSVEISPSVVRLFTNTFIKEVIDSGYKPGVYANCDYVANVYGLKYWNDRDDYVHWLADWTGDADYKSDVHQFSSKGVVSGINGPVDTNYISSKLSKLESFRIALDVIDGKYGNGDERKAALGSNYMTVQRVVNYITKYE